MLHILEAFLNNVANSVDSRSSQDWNWMRVTLGWCSNWTAFDKMEKEKGHLFSYVCHLLIPQRSITLLLIICICNANQHYLYGFTVRKKVQIKYLLCLVSTTPGRLPGMKYSSTSSQVRHYMEVNVQIHSPTALSPRKPPRYPLNRRLGAPQCAAVDAMEKSYISCRCLEPNPRFLGRPTRNLVTILTEILPPPPSPADKNTRSIHDTTPFQKDQNIAPS
jgi:hypothetical protein